MHCTPLYSFIKYKFMLSTMPFKFNSQLQFVTKVRHSLLCASRPFEKYLTNSTFTRLASSISSVKMAPRQVLLLSSSQVHGYGYLEYTKETVIAYLKKNNVSEITFVPYALQNYDAYTKRVSDAINPWGFQVKGVHSNGNPVAAVESAQCIFIGGGNTFLLLKTLYDLGLVEVIRKRILEDGIPYIGSSAGTNVATRSIETTNDMPITFPRSFDALNLVPFNINPHYLDVPDSEKHQGETREERIVQFVELNKRLVLALREGTCLLVDDDKARLVGPLKSRLFYPGKAPIELEANADVSHLF